MAQFWDDEILNVILKFFNPNRGDMQDADKLAQKLAMSLDIVVRKSLNAGASVDQVFESFRQLEPALKKLEQRSGLLQGQLVVLQQAQRAFTRYTPERIEDMAKTAANKIAETSGSASLKKAFEKNNAQIQRLIADVETGFRATGSSPIGRGMVVDIETTSLNAIKGWINEVGAVVFTFRKNDGKILNMQERVFHGLQDLEKEIGRHAYKQIPGAPPPLDVEIARRRRESEQHPFLPTGVTREQLRGKGIFWPELNMLMGKVDVIIAHNAQHEKNFLSKVVPRAAMAAGKQPTKELSPHDRGTTPIWMDSLRLPWKEMGAASKSLQDLLRYHKIEPSGTPHRGLTDAKDTVRLLAARAPGSNQTNLSMLLGLQGPKTPAQQTLEVARQLALEIRSSLQSRIGERRYDPLSPRPYYRRTEKQTSEIDDALENYEKHILASIDYPLEVRARRPAKSNDYGIKKGSGATPEGTPGQIGEAIHGIDTRLITIDEFLRNLALGSGHDDAEKIANVIEEQFAFQQRNQEARGKVVRSKEDIRSGDDLAIAVMKGVNTRLANIRERESAQISGTISPEQLSARVRLKEVVSASSKEQAIHREFLDFLDKISKAGAGWRVLADVILEQPWAKPQKDFTRAEVRRFALDNVRESKPGAIKTAAEMASFVSMASPAGREDSLFKQLIKIIQREQALGRRLKRMMGGDLSGLPQIRSVADASGLPQLRPGPPLTAADYYQHIRASTAPPPPPPTPEPREQEFAEDQVRGIFPGYKEKLKKLSEVEKGFAAVKAPSPRRLLPPPGSLSVGNEPPEQIKSSEKILRRYPGLAKAGTIAPRISIGEVGHLAPPGPLEEDLARKKHREQTLDQPPELAELAKQRRLRREEQVGKLYTGGVGGPSGLYGFVGKAKPDAGAAPEPRKLVRPTVKEFLKEEKGTLDLDVVGNVMRSAFKRTVEILNSFKRSASAPPKERGPEILPAPPRRLVAPDLLAPPIIESLKKEIGGPLRLYLASQYSRRDELRGYAERLKAAGVEVTSRWLKDTAPLSVSLKQVAKESAEYMAKRDIADIRKAHGVVSFTEDPDAMTRRGARHVEHGYAQAMQKRTYVVGPRENIFHHLPETQHFPTFDEFESHIAKQRPNLLEGMKDFLSSEEGSISLKGLVEAAKRRRDQQFIAIARQEAILKSEDPSLQVGAAVFSPRGQLAAVGANRFPSGTKDVGGILARAKESEELRRLKNSLITHAEVTALERARESAKGGVMYTTAHPCANCAHSIVKAGVKEVRYGANTEPGVAKKWAPYWAQAKEVLKEGGVKLTEIPAEETNPIFEKIRSITKQRPNLLEGMKDFLSSEEGSFNLKGLVEAAKRRRDQQFIAIARQEAILKSEDPSLQVGAAVFSPRGQLAAVGANRFPSGTKDVGGILARAKETPELRALKNSLITHAEVTALERARESARGGTLYATAHPCENCAHRIVQSGVKEVKYGAASDPSVAARWAPFWAKAKEVFDKAGVKMTEIPAEKTNPIFEKIRSQASQFLKEETGTFDPRSMMDKLRGGPKSNVEFRDQIKQYGIRGGGLIDALLGRQTLGEILQDVEKKAQAKRPTYEEFRKENFQKTPEGHFEDKKTGRIFPEEYLKEKFKGFFKEETGTFDPESMFNFIKSMFGRRNNFQQAQGAAAPPLSYEERASRHLSGQESIPRPDDLKASKRYDTLQNRLERLSKGAEDATKSFERFRDVMKPARTEEIRETFADRSADIGRRLTSDELRSQVQGARIAGRTASAQARFEARGEDLRASLKSRQSQLGFAEIEAQEAYQTAIRRAKRSYDRLKQSKEIKELKVGKVRATEEEKEQAIAERTQPPLQRAQRRVIRAEYERQAAELTSPAEIEALRESTIQRLTEAKYPPPEKGAPKPVMDLYEHQTKEYKGRLGGLLTGPTQAQTVETKLGRAEAEFNAKKAQFAKEDEQRIQKLQMARDKASQADGTNARKAANARLKLDEQVFAKEQKAQGKKMADVKKAHDATVAYLKQEEILAGRGGGAGGGRGRVPRSPGEENIGRGGFGNMGIGYSLVGGTLLGMKELIKESTIYAAKTQLLTIATEQMAQAAGLNVGAVRAEIESIKDLGITTQTANQTVAKMIFAELDVAKATKLANVAQNAAILANTTFAEALDRIILGIVTGQTRVLHNMNLQVSMVQTMREIRAEKRIKGEKGEPSEFEKREAMLNKVLMEGTKFAGLFERSLTTAGGQLKLLQTDIEETKNAIGKEFLPAFGQTISLMDRGLHFVQENSNAFAGMAAAVTSVGAAASTVGAISFIRFMMGGAPWWAKLIGVGVGIGAEVALNSNKVDSMVAMRDAALKKIDEHIAQLKAQRDKLDQMARTGKPDEANEAREAGNRVNSELKYTYEGRELIEKQHRDNLVQIYSERIEDQKKYFADQQTFIQRVFVHPLTPAITGVIPKEERKTVGQRIFPLKVEPSYPAFALGGGYGKSGADVPGNTPEERAKVKKEYDDRQAAKKENLAPEIQNKIKLKAAAIVSGLTQAEIELAKLDEKSSEFGATTLKVKKYLGTPEQLITAPFEIEAAKTKDLVKAYTELTEAAKTSATARQVLSEVWKKEGGGDEAKGQEKLSKVLSFNDEISKRRAMEESIEFGKLARRTAAEIAQINETVTAENIRAKTIQGNYQSERKEIEDLYQAKLKLAKEVLPTEGPSAYQRRVVQADAEKKIADSQLATRKKLALESSRQLVGEYELRRNQKNIYENPDLTSVEAITKAIEARQNAIKDPTSLAYIKEEDRRRDETIKLIEEETKALEDLRDVREKRQAESEITAFQRTQELQAEVDRITSARPSKYGFSGRGADQRALDEIERTREKEISNAEFEFVKRSKLKPPEGVTVEQNVADLRQRRDEEVADARNKADRDRVKELHKQEEDARERLVQNYHRQVEQAGRLGEMQANTQIEADYAAKSSHEMALEYIAKEYEAREKSQDTLRAKTQAIQQEEFEYQMRLLAQQKQQIEELKSFAGSWFDIIATRSGNKRQEARNFVVGMGKNVGRTIFQNLAVEIFKNQTGKLGKIIPGQVDKDGKPTLLGRILSGTPFGRRETPDAIKLKEALESSKTAEVALKESVDKLTQAIKDLTGDVGQKNAGWDTGPIQRSPGIDADKISTPELKRRVEAMGGIWDDWGGQGREDGGKVKSTAEVSIPKGRSGYPRLPGGLIDRTGGLTMPVQIPLPIPTDVPQGGVPTNFLSTNTPIQALQDQNQRLSVQSNTTALNSLYRITTSTVALTENSITAGLDNTKAERDNTGTLRNSTDVAKQLLMELRGQSLRQLWTKDRSNALNQAQAVSQSGNWSVRVQDGAGNNIDSQSSALDVFVTNPSSGQSSQQGSLLGGALGGFGGLGGIAGIVGGLAHILSGFIGGGGSGAASDSGGLTPDVSSTITYGGIASGGGAGGGISFPIPNPFPDPFPPDPFPPDGFPPPDWPGGGGGGGGDNPPPGPIDTGILKPTAPSKGGILMPPSGTRDQGILGSGLGTQSSNFSQMTKVLSGATGDMGALGKVISYGFPGSGGAPKGTGGKSSASKPGTLSNIAGGVLATAGGTYQAVQGFSKGGAGGIASGVGGVLTAAAGITSMIPGAQIAAPFLAAGAMVADLIGSLFGNSREQRQIDIQKFMDTHKFIAPTQISREMSTSGFLVSSDKTGASRLTGTAAFPIPVTGTTYAKTPQKTWADPNVPEYYTIPGGVIPPTAAVPGGVPGYPGNVPGYPGGGYSGIPGYGTGTSYISPSTVYQPGNPNAGGPTINIHLPVSAMDSQDVLRRAPDIAHAVRKELGVGNGLNVNMQRSIFGTS